MKALLALSAALVLAVLVPPVVWLDALYVLGVVGIVVGLGLLAVTSAAERGAR